MIALDVETTGLNPSKDDIIQFSAIRVDKNLKIIDEIDIYIKCRYPIPPYITKINGISNSILVAKGLNPKDAAEKIIAFCENEQVVMGHNVDFDLKFIKEFLKKNNTETSLFSEIIDTLKIAREKVDGSHKLSVLAKKAGFKGTNFHNSMEDVRATLCVFKWLCSL